MEPFLTLLEQESTVVFAGAMVLVVLLCVMLVVVVSILRVKSYKNRFLHAQLDQKAQEKALVTLEESFDALYAQYRLDQEALKAYGRLQEKMQTKEQELLALKERLYSVEIENQSYKEDNNRGEIRYKEALEKIALLEERVAYLTEENTRLQVNNKRLFQKIESGMMSQMRERKR